MNTATIEKAIKLLQEKSLKELEELLIYERQKSIMQGNKKSMKLATAVKKILSNNPERPILTTVQHTKDGAPFICDGYCLIKWNEEQDELKAFSQTSPEQSVKADNIIPNLNDCTEYALLPEDKIIINNLDKYIKLYKDKYIKLYKTKNFVPVNVFGKTYNAYLLKDFLAVIGTNFDIIYRQKGIIYGCDMFTNDEIKAICLPLRKAENDKIINETTKEFLEILKNER